MPPEERLQVGEAAFVEEAEEESEPARRHQEDHDEDIGDEVATELALEYGDDGLRAAAPPVMDRNTVEPTRFEVQLG